MNWTPEKDAELTALRAEGLSFDAIGARLGLTKNAALGRAGRLGLLEPSGNPAPTTLERLDRLNVFPPRGDCVFPIGDVGEPDFRFCGAATELAEAPYCRAHMKTAHVSKERAAATAAAWTEERKAAARVVLAKRRSA